MNDAFEKLFSIPDDKRQMIVPMREGKNTLVIWCHTSLAADDVHVREVELAARRIRLIPLRRPFSDMGEIVTEQLPILGQGSNTVPIVASLQDKSSVDIAVQIVAEIYKLGGISDIHIQHDNYKGLIRFRQHSNLYIYKEISAMEAEQLLIGLYTLCALDGDAGGKPAYVRHNSLIGTFHNKTRVPGFPEQLHFRFRKNPTVDDGEWGIIRLIPVRDRQMGLAEIGFDDQQIEFFKSLIARPDGLVIFSGPTSSGKNTTVQALLSLIRDYYTKDGLSGIIATLESPVEQVLPFLNQISASSPAQLLQRMHELMQSNPDVLFLGEVTTTEAASAIMYFALSGHPAFTTIHAKSAIDVLPRLRDLLKGSEWLLSSGALSATVSQRLFMKLCPHCALPVHEAPRLDSRLVKFAERHVPKGLTINTQGCKNCQRGAIGRTVCAEILDIDTAMMEAYQNGGERTAWHLWRERGGRSIADQALGKAQEGLVDVREAYLHWRAHETEALPMPSPPLSPPAAPAPNAAQTRLVRAI
jgi:general secretion pathway protein E